MLFMLRKRPFTEAETADISRNWTQATAVILPGGTAPPLIGDVLSGKKTLAQYETESPRFVSPVWDDSPFYFAIERPFRMPAAIAEPLLKWLLAPSIAMLALFAILGRPRRASIGPYAGSVVYFAALGFGFIAVELALLQNLTLLVGHPIFTLSLLLFTLLSAGGIGSALSGRLSPRVACLSAAALGVTYALVLPAVVPALLWLPLSGRVMVAIAVIAPLGLVMGMPFPQGLRRAGQGALAAPPFYWGLNGILSVVGSVGTVVLALTLGFRAAMIAGALCYVVAALSAGSLSQELNTEVPEERRTRST